MTLKRIRIELARTPEFPEGSTRHAYEFTAPLRADGHLETKDFDRVSQLCTVTRRWGDADDEHGQLIHAKGGKWAFSYAPGDEDDETAFRFVSHVFKPGEYLTVKGHDGADHTFRVVWVRDIPPPKIA